MTRGVEGTTGRRKVGSLSRSEKKEEAQALIRRHWRNSDIARKLQISRNTAAKWRAEYEARLQDFAYSNPHYLEDVLANTIKQIDRGEETIRAAWMQFEKTSDPGQRKGFLDTIARLQSEQNKLLGLMGVKQEVLRQVVAVRAVQEKLLDFMTRALCATDRAQLERFLRSPELAPYMGIPAELDVIDVDAS